MRIGTRALPHSLAIYTSLSDSETDVWSDLQNSTNTVALERVIAAADSAIRRGGAFVIHRQGGDILRNIHRPSELAELIDEVNVLRAENGLEPVKR